MHQMSFTPLIAGTQHTTQFRSLGPIYKAHQAYTMKTIIIDDEQPAINILTNFVQKVPFLQLELATNDAFEGLQLLNSEAIDLLLLDIEMPDITGIELLKSLRKKPQVIFTTAYEKYALDGYELDVVDYLVKPIRFERFLKAVNKAQQLQQITSAQAAPPSEGLIIKVNYKNIKLSYSELCYFEGLKDYIKVYTHDNMYLTRLNLKAIQSKLPSDQFIRVHRSYIVAQDKITSFQKGQLFLGKTAIPIGISYQEELQRRLENRY